MIRLQALEDCIRVQCHKENMIIPFKLWKEDEEAFAYFDILKEYLENGQALSDDNGCDISYDSVYEMSPSEKRLLTIPESYPYMVYIQGKGLLKDESFRFTLDFRESKLGRRFPVTRTGAIIKTGENQYLLSAEQMDLVDAIEQYNALPVKEKSFNDTLIEFSKIKSLSQKTRATLDKYLTAEEVFVPGNLKIKIEKSDADEYSIIPSIDSPLSDQFDKYLASREEVPDNIALSSQDNNRTRVVLDKKKCKIIKELRSKYQRLSARKLKDIVENPELYIDADQCDISEFFSNRVIEIGLYHPKFFPFISPYKSSWLPVYEVQDRVNGTSKLKFESIEEVDQFEEISSTAKANNEDAVTYKDILLNVDDALEMAAHARRTFEQHEFKEKQEKKSLIIEGNEETLGYSVDIKRNEDYGYTFHEIPGLRQSIHLKKHQKEGIAWLQKHLLQKDKGCLLADDMGLGKTLQLLSLIDWYDKSSYNNNKPYLIVAPVSLVENWKMEYEKFFELPRIEVLAVTGSDLSRSFSRGIDHRLIELLNQRQIVITNYETIRSFQFSFCAVDFAIIVLDEAQKIKTPGILVTNAAKALKGDFKVAMTGTPVENTLVDLWCIMDFALPGLLGNCKEFAKKYQAPLKSEDTDIEMLGNQVRDQMGSFFIRRLKTDVAKDLPTKYVDRFEMRMPDVQAARYKDAIAQALSNKEKAFAEPGYMLKCIHSLREISDHPFLSNDWENLSVEELIDSSAKMKAILPIMDEIRSCNEKVIVFAERREVQNMLKRIIRFRYQLEASIVNGETPTTRNARFKNGKMSRQQTIDDFQSKKGFNVIIMSPIAAGMGLNVTGANHVIHYSRHWNPAKEDQATDRVYRIGQNKDVHVYYPMAILDGMNSFDQTLDGLLKQKSQLAAATLFPTARIEVNSEELFNKLFQ